MTQAKYKKALKEELIKYRTSLNLPEEVTFGIEIEYEGIVKDTLTYFIDLEKLDCPSLIEWQNKSEIHIQEYNRENEIANGEVVSPILRDEINTWKSLKRILNLLNSKGAIITEKCGGHVNVGSHILGKNSNYWINFFLLWILYEKEIYKFSSGEFKKVRVDKDGLFKCINKEINIDLFLNNNNKIEKFLKTIRNYIKDKKHCIFICNNFSKKIIPGNRIEFRIPNGTLNEEIWQNYINFFTKFVLACKKELDVEKLIFQINNNEHNIIDLVNYVFENDIDKENFIIQALKTNKAYKKELLKHIIYN